MLRYLLLSILTGLVLSTAIPVWAGSVRGTVILPEELKIGRRFLGHWRIENTTVGVQPAPARGDTVVLLVGPKTETLAPKNTPVEIIGMQASPATVVVGEGAVVEFRSTDKVAHELYVPGRPDIMEPQYLTAGSVRKQRFGVEGEYVVRCRQFPHITISVIVTRSPFFATTDEKGGFKLLDVPDGPATLKVWSNGRWVHESAIEVTPKGVDLNIRVAAPSKEASEP